MPESGPKLKILHVVDSLERGGLERFAADLAISQCAAGHSVAVFCLYTLGPIAGELDSAGIRVSCGEKRAGFDLRLLARLRAFSKESQADVVHAHNLVPNYYSAIALLGRRRVALVNTCHDMGTRLSNKQLRRLYVWSIGRTRQFAMVAEDVTRRYVDGGLIPAARARTIQNGIPLPPNEPSRSARESARAKLKVSADTDLIGCVGRLVALKNHRLVIFAAADLAGEFPHLKLVLIGGGILEDELRQLTRDLGIEEKVNFAGERSDVRELLPALDVFALPSLTEGMSIALIEAASASLALVASNVGGNARLIADGRTGLLFPSDDRAALAKALRALLQDRSLRVSLGAAARAWALREASIETSRRLYDELYRDSLPRAQSRAQ